MKQKTRSECKRVTPKAILRLPDLEVAKSAVLNSLSCPDAQRGYRHAIDEFVDWYCSEPRLSFTKTVVARYQPTPSVQSQGNTSASASSSGSDTVQLSPTAQATAMQQQGMSVPEIASSMGLTTAEVDTYLGIAAASSSGGGIPVGGGANHAPAPIHSAAAASSGSKPQPTSSQPTKT